MEDICVTFSLTLIFCITLKISLCFLSSLHTIVEVEKIMPSHKTQKDMLGNFIEIRCAVAFKTIICY